MTYKGNYILRERDYFNLVDYCVTGSKEETASDPKFPIINVFWDDIFYKGGWACL